MRRSLLFAALLLSGGVAAHADTLLTFTDVTGVDLTSMTGSFTINAAGTITALDITVVYPGQAANTFTSLADIQFAGEFSPNYYIQIASDQGDQFAAGGGQISIVLVPSTLAGYVGGPICTSVYDATADGSSCQIGSSYTKNDVTGNDAFNGLLTGSLNGTPLVSTSATPEPSSLALLGSGALGLAGMLRRRIRR